MIHFDLANKSKRIEELEREMEAADFWNDAAQSTAKMKELKSLKDDVSIFSHLQELYEEIDTYITLGYEENDPDLLPEIESLLQEFDGELEELRMKTLLSDEYDDRNAIVSLHAGAGGTESCDWVSMLYRMYTRWAVSRGYEVEVLDYLDGEEAGIKSVTFQVNGANAYGYLKSERVSTVWYVSRLLMQQAKGRLPLHPATSCRSWMIMSRWRSMMTISVSIPIGPAVLVASTSTRHHLPSVSRTSRLGSWYNARMSVPSI